MKKILAGALCTARVISSLGMISFADETEAAGSGGEAAAPAPVQNPTAQRKVVEFRVVADPVAAKALGAFLRGNGIRYEILRFQNEGDGDKWTVPAKR